MVHRAYRAAGALGGTKLNLGTTEFHTKCRVISKTIQVGEIYDVAKEPQNLIGICRLVMIGCDNTYDDCTIGTIPFAIRVIEYKVSLSFQIACKLLQIFLSIFSINSPWTCHFPGPKSSPDAPLTPDLDPVQVESGLATGVKDIRETLHHGRLP